ncbi:DUF2973 domain-containing protein [Cyanobium sp. ATX 6F1]|uniref:DUF2973 domain-containing protein n=1 Tax=unclassified Cyanobium TaxID=2627006 RepID=UPI0020CE2D19|nr:DUF2973 domain-containing protein [Cyanobium sp. ATX 6F1]MCP9917416.1 DUF2973 domain-containing protein [Cyanobium sp. ATX 6F1]
MSPVLSQLLPLAYAACVLVLLYQAFKVMGQGYKAIPRPGDAGAVSSVNTPTGSGGSDRTGRLTIHPELLDSDGQITQDDLLTVRFSGDNEQTALPRDPA